jgi:hypothetical protein
MHEHGMIGGGGGQMADQAYAKPQTYMDSPKEESASMRLTHAQEQMWKAIEALETKVPHLLGPDSDLAEVRPDEVPATAFHNYARVTELQVEKLRSLTRRLEV